MASTSSSISPSNTRNHSVSDQITQIAGNAAVHDAKGNLTEYEINSKQYNVNYDLENRIIKVDVNNSDVEYRYDALGRQIIRKEGSTQTALIWWGNSECAEYEHNAGQATIQNDIMSHPTALNAVIARAVEGSKFDLEFYHKNYLDHVYAVSDDSGNLDEHYRYTAFGEATIYNGNGTIQTTSQVNNSILWNTRRLDSASGYYLYKYRHYDPALGRWPSRDPIEESGSVNLYSFVNNAPLFYYDLLGLIEGSEENKEKRKALNDAANASTGTKDYNLDVKTPRTPAGDLKCTDYVYGISRANKKTPKVPAKKTKDGGYMYPLAADLADPKHKMKDWRQLKEGEKPEPGDIVSTGVHAGVVTDNTEGNVSAHVSTNSGGSAVYGMKGQFSSDPNSVYWRYTGK